MKIAVVALEDGSYVNVKDLVDVLKAFPDAIDRDRLIAKLTEAVATASLRDE